MKKIAASFLALAGLVVFSTVARAVWDSTLGNMPEKYQLCWGLSNNACIYGGTVSNLVRIQTGGVDALTVNASQVVTVPGTFAVTGASTFGLLPNVSTFSAAGVPTFPSLNVTGASAMTGAVSVSTAAAGATPFVIDGAYSTVQIQAKTPTAAGQLVYNTTLANVCVSTGTTIQAYKLAGTASTTCQ